MRTIEQIRALLLAEKDESKRNELLDELLQARDSGDNQPTKAEQARSELTVIASQRTVLADEYEAVTRGAVDEHGNARDFTAEEAEKRGRLSVQIETLDARHDSLEDQARQAEADEREARMDAKLAEFRKSLGFSGGLPLGADGINGIGVTEKPVYEKRNGVSYLKDITVQSFGPGLGSAWSQARQRLEVHAQQNHHRALELEEKIERRSEQEREKNYSKADAYFVRQMVEASFDRNLTQGQAPVTERQLSYRALSTGSGAGGEFVPPMYLTEQWIAFLRAGRVFANCLHHEDLPDGTMSINIPKVASGTSVDVQGTQNTNVSMTDITTQFVTVPVFTAAGAQIISLQLLERSPIHFDTVIWSDLAKAQAQRMDTLCLNGSGSAGQPTGLLNTAGINTITWTQATPTLKGLFGQVALGKVDIHNSIYLPATHQFLTPNCWGWIEQTFDTSGRPVVVPSYNGPFNAAVVDTDDDAAEGALGKQMLGLATFQDANIPQTLGGGSNQDVDIVGRMDEAYLYESPVVTRALPQTFGLQMSVLLQLYGYGALTFARYPAAFGVVTGTGMSQTNRVFNS